MTPDVDLTVMIVTYDCQHFIGACLRSVRSTTTRHRVEIVVADNASADGSVAAVRCADPQARVICMASNTGFATANNAALRAATGRYVLLLNPDTVVGPGALDALVDLLDAQSWVGVAAPALVYPDGRPQLTARAFPTAAAAVLGRRSPVTRMFPANPWSRRYLMPQTGQEAYEVDWVSGACLMVRRDLLLSVEGLDESFFMHWEDADLCRRIKDTGHAVVCLPVVTVIHAEGGSRQGWPPGQVRMFHDGAYRYWCKHRLQGRRSVLRPVVRVALSTRANLIIATGAVRTRRPHVLSHPAAHTVPEA